MGIHERTAYHFTEATEKVVPRSREWRAWESDLIDACKRDINRITDMLEEGKDDRFTVHRGRKIIRDRHRILTGMRRDLRAAVADLEGHQETGTDWTREAGTRREVRLTPDVLENMPEPEERERPEFWAVTDFLGRLTDQQREVFQMVHGGGMTRREVAELTGMSEGNVYNVLKATEKKRKKFVEEYGKGMIL